MGRVWPGHKGLGRIPAALLVGGAVAVEVPEAD